MDIVTFTLMVFLLSWRGYAEEDAGLLCPEHQKAFDGACFELVGLQLSFLRAQAWCERGGGHLVFILNDETQQFIQTLLEPEKNWWLGLAPAAPNLTLDTAATQGEGTSEYETSKNLAENLFLYVLYFYFSKLDFTHMPQPPSVVYISRALLEMRTMNISVIYSYT